MTAISRYILRQLLVGMLLVTVGLTCVIWLTQSLRLVDMIVNRGLSAGMFLYLNVLLLPNFLSITLPIALFAVVVFTYSKLIVDRELIVMRAAGLGQMALAAPALALAGVVVVVGYVLNFHLLPVSYEKFRKLQWDIRYNYSHILLQEGTFNVVMPEITVYVRERSPEGELRGILVHDQRGDGKPITIMAERGALMETDEGSRVVMFNGNRQQVDKATSQLSILYFDRYIFDIQPTGAQEQVRYRESRERSFTELINIENDHAINPQDYGRFKVEAHRRLISPLWGLGFTLVGLACLLSGGFSRGTQTGRIVVAVALVVALQATALGVENLAAKRLRMVPLMYVHALLPIAIGYLCMLRAFGWRLQRPATAGASG
jgi:lipopolysaccharide export system permease protein